MSAMWLYSPVFVHQRSGPSSSTPQCLGWKLVHGHKKRTDLWQTSPRMPEFSHREHFWEDKTTMAPSSKPAAATYVCDQGSTKDDRLLFPVLLRVECNNNLHVWLWTVLSFGVSVNRPLAGTVERILLCAMPEVSKNRTELHNHSYFNVVWKKPVRTGLEDSCPALANTPVGSQLGFCPGSVIAVARWMSGRFGCFGADGRFR